MARSNPHNESLERLGTIVDSQPVTAGVDLAVDSDAILLDIASPITVTYPNGRQQALPPLAANVWHPMTVRSVDVFGSATQVAAGYTTSIDAIVAV